MEVVARLKALEESAAPLVAFLQNPAAVQELRADKQYNLQMLNDRYQVHSWSQNYNLFFLLYLCLLSNKQRSILCSDVISSWLKLSAAIYVLSFMF